MAFGTGASWERSCKSMMNISETS